MVESILYSYFQLLTTCRQSSPSLYYVYKKTKAGFCMCVCVSSFFLLLLFNEVVGNLFRTSPF